MRNKILYSFSIVLFLCSCNPDKKYTEHKTSIPFPYSDLPGNWAISSIIYHTDDGDKEAIGNVAPTIYFHHNNTAIITFPSKKTESYEWTTNSDTLLLRIKNPITTMPYFLHLKYKMSYKREKDFLELRLSTEGLTYKLTRSGKQ
jgi:hypothetical protein